MQSDPVSSRVNAFLKHVGALSLGTAGLGGVYQQVEDPARLAADTISASVMRGMTLIDTAPWYLNSEEMVGIGLKQTGIPREQVLLASKVGRYRSEINPSGDFDYSSERIVVSVASSCAKLHTNHIDVVYLHDIEFVGAVEVDAALVALEELQQTGVVGLIGICGYPLPVLDATVARNKGRIQVVQSYSHLTLQNNALLPYAERWSEMGIIVINAAPLSMGLLSNRGSPAWHPASSQLREACIAAARIPTLSL
ncbi:NADP-dependent oxidoreductase domain-containing protein [Chytriomyces sp. MP71]|nr:NADP-dependent oxidoreductase domain-containing protein [Chytriomyces sp. MP71]